MMMLALYLCVTIPALLALALMILAVARAAVACPEDGPRARAAGIAIATGYTAIGAGAVLLIGTLVALAAEPGLPIFAMGLAVLVLGLGFSQAMTTLRAAVRPVQPAKVPLEPVLG
jgi:hypothetical protein